MSRYTSADEDEAFVEGANEMKERCADIVRQEGEKMKKAYGRHPLLSTLADHIADFIDDIANSLDRESLKP